MYQYTDTYITIDREALTGNAEYFIRKSGKKLIAVVKSNAYGHGIVNTAKILENTADLFAVASLDEAILLRQQGIKKPILVLNPLEVKFVREAVRYDIMISASTLDYLKELESLYENLQVKVHLKLDTGMNRMGVKSIDEYRQILAFAHLSSVIRLIGLYTHFHTPDDDEYSLAQLQKFYEFYQSESFSFEYIHLCATNAVLYGRDIPESTHVRIGLGLYGLCESDFVKPALSLYSRIVLVKELKAGETVSYNANYKASIDEKIGILPIGYSDGILRKNVGRSVYVDGYYCEILGTICMNSLIIRLPEAEIKKEAELIGPHVSAKQIAQHLHTIPYEVVTCLLNEIMRITV